MELGASGAISPYDGYPALRVLMDAVTFYHSFDHESLAPDMATGDWKFQRHGEPQLAPGLIGKALVAGTGALLFTDARNWTIATRGAFNAMEFREKPDPSLSGGFMLGSRGGDHTLLDEFFCFNRPLSEDEVRALYETLRPRGNLKRE